MTGGAVLSKLAVMEIVAGMTGITICRRAFELEVGMTFGTGNACMLTVQLEDRVVVVKVTGLPSAGCMARGAICAKRAAVRICVTVTGGTVRWGAFE